MQKVLLPSSHVEKRNFSVQRIFFFYFFLLFQFNNIYSVGSGKFYSKIEYKKRFYIYVWGVRVLLLRSTADAEVFPFFT